MARVKRTECLACRSPTPYPSTGLPTEVHHLTSCGMRLGHEFTIALCQWHHRGEPPMGHSKSEATKIYGPSYADGRKPFMAVYGTDSELLEEQNRILEQGA